MQFQRFLDPFGVERAARDEESQIAARDVRSSVDLFNMQQAMDQMRNRRAYLQEVAQEGQQPKAAPGQPQPQQPPSQPSASDMILGELGQIDKRISSAAKYGLNDEQDKLFKLREQAMGRYSLAKDREVQATDRVDKQRKEAVAAVSRYASGANAILSDDKATPEDKRQQLEALEAAARDENPQAYKVLTQGQPKIDWADPRTWNRMKALEQQAIDPDKRVERTIQTVNAQTRRLEEEARTRHIDAMIAAAREGRDRKDEPHLPAGYRWKNKERTEMEAIPGSPASDRNSAAGEWSTPEGIDLAAETVLAGQPMPAMGGGKAAAQARGQIWARAAQLAKDRGMSLSDVPAARAQRAADQSSLTKITSQLDAVTSFENTAIKNGEVAVKLAEKVDTTGVPAIERWIRAGRKEIAGDVDVNNLNAQMMLFGTEVAKILTNPNLSGQLTDSARHEVQEFMPTRASAAQVRGLVDLLRQDFTRRHEALNDQRKEVIQRLRHIGTRVEDQTRLPKPNEIQDGFRYKGGDPSKKENWEEVKQ